MSNEREKLIIDLKRIKENEYQLDNTLEVMELATMMLKYVGDTDPDLRDHLIYSTFCQWICEKQYFNDEQLIRIVDTLLDQNHLFFHIGNDEDDTVFTRTFSVLLIDVLLYWNRVNTYLPTGKFNEIKADLIRYYNEEKDLRGYLDSKGWAHGAAHGADAMCELVCSKESNENTILEVLGSLRRVLSNGKYLLSNEEDERMTRVMFLVVMKNLVPEGKIVNWIEELGDLGIEDSREQYVTKVNTKNFIRCLYFSLMRQQKTKSITNLLFQTEEKLNSFVQVDKALLN